MGVQYAIWTIMFYQITLWLESARRGSDRSLSVSLSLYLYIYMHVTSSTHLLMHVLCAGESEDLAEVSS